MLALSASYLPFYLANRKLGPTLFPINELLKWEYFDNPYPNTKNANFVIIKEDKSGYFVKQAISTDSITNRIKTEREVLRFLSDNNLDNNILKTIESDTENQVIIYELIKFPQNLDEFIENLPGGGKVVPYFEVLGEFLRKVHLLKIDNTLLKLDNFKPYLLKISSDEINIFIRSRKIEMQEVGEFLSNNRIRLEKFPWNHSSIIHGDLKMNNILVDSSAKIILIDWELAAIGDPLWDIAFIAKEYLIRVEGRSGSLFSYSGLRAFLYPYNEQLVSVIQLAGIILLQEIIFIFSTAVIHRDKWIKSFSLVKDCFITPQLIIDKIYS